MQKKGKKGLSGKELFTIDPSSFKKDDEAAETEYVFEKEQTTIDSPEKGKGKDGKGGKKGKKGKGKGKEKKKKKDTSKDEENEGESSRTGENEQNIEEAIGVNVGDESVFLDMELIE